MGLRLSSLLAVATILSCVSGCAAETGASPSEDNIEEAPGAPQLVVTDANFSPVASARGRKTELGGEATLRVDPNRGKFVLVRDRLWVLPMTFQVTVG